MIKENNKQLLLQEIRRTAQLFINEFDNIQENDKDRFFAGVDKTPAQMIAYQLGWLKLVKSWDDTEVRGDVPILPAAGYKWNRLGALYQSFYDNYQSYSLAKLIQTFEQELTIWCQWVESLSDDVLFIKDKRNWTKPYPENWTVARFIQINSIAPFKSFRTKIRKWKKLNDATVADSIV